MKKIIIILVVLILAGGGYYFYSQSKNKPVIPKVGRDGKPLVGLQVIQDDSLTGWLKRKKTVECKLTGSTGDITMQVKNDKVRIEGIPYAFGQNGSQNNGYSLTDGDWMYMWSGKEGTKLNLKSMQANMTEEQKAQATSYSWEDSAKKWETDYRYDCAEKKLSDGLFVPPSDVNFVDMTNTMNDAQNAAKKIQEDATSGQNVNQEDIEAQIEKMKESVPDQGGNL